MKKIPFNAPKMVGSELHFIKDAIERAKLSGDGFYTAACQAEIAALAGGGECLLAHSCTAALEMAAILADIGPGDEVIMPSYTFVSTANAVVLRGGIPVFVDIRPDTMNLDESLVEEAIGKRTRAIIAVHYAGVPAEMDTLNEIAVRHRFLVIEDAAQALGSRYRGRTAGSLGAMAAFSFHETKNIISGEGGALIVNDASLADRAQIIREKGTNRRQFLRGAVDKYTWVDVGSSYLPSELVAAFLHGQLERVASIQHERMQAWERYLKELSDLSRIGFGLPRCPAHCEHNAHLFQLIAPSEKVRNRMIEQLSSDEIETPFHYVPLHSSPMGRRVGRVAGRMDVTDDLSSRLLRLPLYVGIGEVQHRVIERVRHHAKSFA